MSMYNNLSDEELVDLIKVDDDMAFHTLHNRYYGILYTHIYKRFPYREDVRDLVQELFTWLWDNRKQLELTSGLSAYLFTAARNRLFKVYRRQKVRTQYVDSLQAFINQGEYTTDRYVDEKELMELVNREIAALPPQMQLIFEMSRNEELSHKEIAEKLKLSPHTVRTQVRSALRILRVKLGVNIFFIFF